MQYATYYVLIAVIIAGIVWLVVALIQKERERKKQWLCFLRELGFMPVELPDAELIKKLKDMNPPLKNIER